MHIFSNHNLDNLGSYNIVSTINKKEKDLPYWPWKNLFILFILPYHKYNENNKNRKNGFNNGEETQRKLWSLY